MSNLSTVTYVAHKQHFKFLDVGDQELPKATGQHVLSFLISPITNVKHQDLAHESSAYPIVSASRFLPVMLNFNILV